MKKYTDDYELVATTDEEGREKKQAVYRGMYFDLSIDEEGVIRFRRISFMLLFAILITHISGGFVGNPGMYQFYIALPYVFAFFPLLYLAAGVLHLPKAKRKFRRDEIGHSFDRMKSSSIMLMIFLSSSVLGEIVFLLFVFAGEFGLLEIVYLALEMLAAGAVYILMNYQRQIQILPCNQEISKEPGYKPVDN